MQEVAVVAYSQSDCLARAGAINEVELIMPPVSYTHLTLPTN